MHFRKLIFNVTLTLSAIIGSAASAQYCYNVNETSSPTANIYSPSDQQNVSGSIWVNYSGSSGSGTDAYTGVSCSGGSYTVSLSIDNGASVDSGGSYYYLNTTTIPNGQHTLNVSVSDSYGGTASTEVTVYVLNFHPNQGGPFSVGPGVYEANPQGHYCGIIDPSYLQIIGVSNAYRQVPALSSIPAGYVNDGACTPGNHIFNVNGGVYYENGSGQYCQYPDPSYLIGLAGGQTGYSLDRFPPNLTNVGWCEPINMNFTVAGGVYHEGSNKHYCHFQDPSFLRALGGGVVGPTLDQMPNDVINDGACQPVNQNFNVNGGVYYENSSKHYCHWTDPSYLKALGGNNIGVSLDAMPQGAISDGECQPANQNFNVNGGVYYENANRHVCGFQDPSYLAAYGGNNVGASLDMFPIGATYDGLCEPVGQAFRTDSGPVGKGAVYYMSAYKSYCWVPSWPYLVKLNGGNAGAALDATPGGATYTGVCAPLK